MDKDRLKQWVLRVKMDGENVALISLCVIFLWWFAHSEHPAPGVAVLEAPQQRMPGRSS